MICVAVLVETVIHQPKGCLIKLGGIALVKIGIMGRKNSPCKRSYEIGQFLGQTTHRCIEQLSMGIVYNNAPGSAYTFPTLLMNIL